MSFRPAEAKKGSPTDESKKVNTKSGIGIKEKGHHKGERTDLRNTMKGLRGSGEGFVRLRQERKGKEDLKNRQVSGFCVWEAVKKEM